MNNEIETTVTNWKPSVHLRAKYRIKCEDCGAEAGCCCRDENDERKALCNFRAQYMQLKVTGTFSCATCGAGYDQVCRDGAGDACSIHEARRKTMREACHVKDVASCVIQVACNACGARAGDRCRSPSGFVGTHKTRIAAYARSTDK